jgi:hypothetical protein
LYKVEHKESARNTICIETVLSEKPGLDPHYVKLKEGSGSALYMLSDAILEPCLLNSVVNTILRDSVTRFLTLGFFHESGSPQPRWCTLTCKYLRKFLKKFEMTLILLSEAWGKIIHEKNQRQKIS